MNILVINAGSSSVKYQLINMDNESVIAKGLVERIGLPGSALTHKVPGKEDFHLEKPMNNHGDGIREVIAALTDKDHGVISDLSSIAAVGHRVLHGGSRFTQPAVVDEDVLSGIRDCIELGPLHNPANIKGIETCMELMPGIANVAVFDTAFHQTMPDYAFLYGIPYEDYEKYKIRKYGFHGTSHMFLSQRIPQMFGRSAQGLKVITCHLGNGSSLCAIKDGKCVDTSMGLTPLEGLVMGTRSGDIDPTVVPFLMERNGMSADQLVNTYLNKKSGVLGISGVSSDFRDLAAAEEAGNPRAKIALDMFAYRIKKYIGSYAAAMGGVDVLAFAGGIGENDCAMRARCTAGLEFLGIKLDQKKNAGLRGKEAEIQAADSAVKVLVVPTNEEVMIARETLRLTSK